MNSTRHYLFDFVFRVFLWFVGFGILNVKMIIGLNLEMEDQNVKMIPGYTISYLVETSLGSTEGKKWGRVCI